MYDPSARDAAQPHRDLARDPRARAGQALGLTANEYALSREAGPRAHAGRARDVLADVERALLLQALQEAARHAADRGAATSSSARARTPAPCRPPTAGSPRSRSSATTTRPRSSRSRAPRPASAASCATSSPSAPARSPSSTRCASASRGQRALALPARRRRLRHRPLRQPDRRPEHRRRRLLRGPLRDELPRQRDGDRPRAQGDDDALRRRGPRQRADRLFGASTGRDGIGGASVLASPSSARTTRASARPSRSATRSRRRRSWSARSSCSSAA